ncbi:MAG TPA: hypothetical protein VMY35_03115 [Phycisphaerae bacterium]|nr:hypothetical protein [Phycisphaerae bacterium]
MGTSGTASSIGLAAITLDGAFITTAIIVWIVTQAIASALTARITAAVLSSQTKNLHESLGKLAAAVASHEEQIAQLRIDRAGCQLEAARTYSTRGELMRVVVDQTALSNQLFTRIDEFQTSMRDSVGKVHTRVDEAVKELSEIKGQLKERSRGAAGPA